MASVILDRVWLHRADDHGTFVTVHVPPDGLSVDADRDVDYRVRAGGRVVQVTTPARRRTIGISGHSVSREVLDTLEAWAGSVLMCRLPSGEVDFGSFREVSALPKPDGLHDVSLTFNVVSHSVEV